MNRSHIKQTSKQSFYSPTYRLSVIEQVSDGGDKKLGLANLETNIGEIIFNCALVIVDLRNRLIACCSVMLRDFYYTFRLLQTVKVQFSSLRGKERTLRAYACDKTTQILNLDTMICGSCTLLTKIPCGVELSASNFLKLSLTAK